MESVDFFSLSRPETLTETREFLDPMHPDSPISVTLSTCGDYGTQTLAVEVGKQNGAKFVRRDDNPRPASFPPLGGRPVPITSSLCLQIGTLMVLQAAPTSYNFNQWVACSVTCPTAFGDIVEWANALLFRATNPGQDDPNDSADHGEVS